MSGTASVKMFGKLFTLRRERGLPDAVDVPVPDEGVSAADLAAGLGLPPEEIEGVFCNHRVFGLDHVIRPGDAVAFVPRGTPGPHRFTLGLYAAGKGRS